MVSPVIAIEGLHKTYSDGFQALKAIDLSIEKGEIFALLGPNGAGKTTLISIICGLVNASGGRVLADGHDIVSDYKAARRKIGLVPQELATESFETVWHTVRYSRGLFGRPKDDDHIEQVLRALTLWDKRNSPILALSGGMKRRVMIAKALAHEPKILFLDEPTAGVDVELRREMWALVRRLREQGVTIILTTHYIEEAEEMADRVGIINNGELVLVDRTDRLMSQWGQKTLNITLEAPLSQIPPSLQHFGLRHANEALDQLVYVYGGEEHASMDKLLEALRAEGIRFVDLQTQQSSLEDIFVDLVAKDGDRKAAGEAR